MIVHYFHQLKMSMIQHYKIPKEALFPHFKFIFFFTERLNLNKIRDQEEIGTKIR